MTPPGSPGKGFARSYKREKDRASPSVDDHIAAIFANWPDLRFEERATYAGANFVVQEWRAHATHSTGVPLTWDGVDIFPFEGEKILRKGVYSNASRVIPQQLAGNAS